MLSSALVVFCIVDAVGCGRRTFMWWQEPSGR